MIIGNLFHKHNVHDYKEITISNDRFCCIDWYSFDRSLDAPKSISSFEIEILTFFSGEIMIKMDWGIIKI
jgi:hypothetical protein